MKRSVLSVIAGILVIVVASTVVDVVLHAAGVYPPGQPLDHTLSLIASSYRFVITIGGAYLTARLAPARPMKHALILGVVGTILGLVGVAATWGQGMGPTWYPVSLAALALPECWLGGRLYVARNARA